MKSNLEIPARTAQKFNHGRTMFGWSLSTRVRLFKPTRTRLYMYKKIPIYT